MKKMPPIEKIYEAYGAIADQRINISENQATVLSSDHTKKYTVICNNNEYSSNDNSTYWQGYPGYPVIGVLMLQEKLPLDMSVANNFKGINWKELNAKYRNNYSKALAEVFSELQKQGVLTQAIEASVAHVFETLQNLDIQVKRNSKKPEKVESL